LVRPHRSWFRTPYLSEPLERRLLLYNTYDGDPKWGFSDITYSFTNALDGGLQGVTVNQIRTAVAEAFAMWAAVTPLQFRENIDPNPSLVTDETYDAAGLPIIRIGQHNQGGPLGTLAHAYQPGENGRNGDTHFDISETWTFGPTNGNTIDILEVAAHEIGHTIGLDHETVNPSLMVPNHAALYSGSGTGSLLADDIAGIQHLYGAGLGYAIDVLGNMWVAGTSGLNTLSLSYNPVNSTINVVSNGFGSFSRSINGISKITFLGSGGTDVFNIGRTPFPVEVDGGTGSDQLNLFGYDTTNNYVLNGNSVIGHSVGTHSNIESMALFGSNSAGDTFTVNSAPTIPFTINGQGGGDTFTLNVLSTNLVVTPDTGNDTIEINEPSAPFGAPTITLAAGDGDDLFRVTRLTRGLVLNGGIGHDTFDVARGATMAGAVLGSIVVNGQDGNDVVNLAPSTTQANATTAAISIFGGNDNDTLNLGGGSVSSVGGAVTFDGNSHTGPGNTININDTARTSDVPWFINTTTVGRGLGGPDVTYNSNTSRIILNCGSGNDDIAVASGVGPILEVYGNNGNDEFIVGGGLMDAGAGPIAGAFAGGNGTDQITYDDHLRSGGVIWDIRPTQVIYGGIFVLATNSFEAVGVLAGNGDDQIFFYNDIGSKPITVDAGGGNDLIDTNHCRALNLTITGGAGSDKLEVDDVGIPTGTIFQHIVSGGQVLRFDFVAEYYVNYGGIEQVDLLLPAQQNSVNVTGTAAAYTQIIGTTSSDNIVVNPRDGAGNATIGGQVNIFCGDGADSLEFDASASSVPSEFIVGVDLFGFNPQVGMVGGGSVMVQNSEAMRVRAGGGPDIFRVNQFVNIGITPTLDVFGGDGHDALYLGNANLPEYANPVTAFNFDGQGGTDTFNLDNSAATGQWTYENTATDVAATRVLNGAYFERFNYVRIEQLNVYAAAGNDTFNLFALNSGQGLRFTSGAGTNGMNLIDTSLIRGPIFYDNGNAGGINNINKLTVSSSPITLHVETNSIGAHPNDTFFGPDGSLQFNSVTNVSLTMGSGNDVVYAKPSPSAAITLRGGNPTTAPGDTIHLALANATNYSIGPGPFGVGFRITSSNNQTLDYSDFETVNTDAVAPQILSRSFNPTVGAQSVSYTFDQDVSASLNASSLQVSSVDPAMIAYSYSANTATWTFPGLGGVLPSRLYIASVGGATDPAGNAATGANAYSFLWVNGTPGDDVFRITRGPSNGFLEIFVGGAPTPTYSVKSTAMNQFNLNAGGGDDVITIDHARSGRPPIPAGSSPFFDGGDSGGDQLVLTGTAGNNAAAFDTASVSLDGFAFTHAGVELRRYESAGGLDSLSVNSGTVSLTTTEHLANLSVAAGATAAMTPGGNKALVLDALSVAAGGRLDAADNAMIFTNSTVSAVRALVAAGFNEGRWDGSGGINSSTAAADPSGLTALGYASNAELNRTSFGGVMGLTSTDVLVRFTYAGDANLDGQVDIGDLGLLAGAWQQPSGKSWFDGDFTYDGAVDIGDLGLLAGSWQKGVGNPL
jgi:hypothetical protein